MSERSLVLLPGFCAAEIHVLPKEEIFHPFSCWNNGFNFNRPKALKFADDINIRETTSITGTSNNLLKYNSMQHSPKALDNVGCH